MPESDNRKEPNFEEPSSEKGASVRILGSLGRTVDGRKISNEIVKTPIKIRDLLEYLQKNHGLELRIDSTLVMVNGIEARALEDVETSISSGDEVVILPMFHGG